MKRIIVNYQIPIFFNNQEDGVISQTIELTFSGEVVGSLQDWIMEAQYQEYCAAAHQSAAKNDWTYFKGVKQPHNQIVSNRQHVYQHVPIHVLKKAKILSFEERELVPDSLGKIYKGVLYGDRPHKEEWLQKTGFTLTDFFK